MEHRVPVNATQASSTLHCVVWVGGMEWVGIGVVWRGVEQSFSSTQTTKLPDDKTCSREDQQ